MNNDIKQFILSLRDKDYSAANRTLEQIVEKKLAERVKKSAKKVSGPNFFKNLKKSNR